MDLKQLEAYVRVYETKSFSKTAEIMFLSQPSISAYINSLEKELQTQLIYRSTKELLPTKAGKLFYEYAREMLSLRDKSVISVKNLSDFPSGSIDILASSVPAQCILPEILGVFHKKYPDIRFNVEQADTLDVVKGISALKSEIGFVGSMVENDKCLYEEFMSEKLIMITPQEKRFAIITQDDIVDLLRNEYFVMREAGSGTRFEYEACIKNLGVSVNDLHIVACFNNTQNIITAVANGLGLSIVSELAARYYIQQKLIIPIRIDCLPERHFYTVIKKNCALSASAEFFIKFIRSYKGKYNS